MNTKKHRDHPHLTGEQRWGDTGQVMLLILFLTVWALDSFVYRYSTFLAAQIPLAVRFAMALLSILAGWLLVRGGMKEVFGTRREKPEVIDTGVFSVVRHPIYLGAVMFCLGILINTMSLFTAVVWLMILGFYIYIARYEEKILSKEFGTDYLKYQQKVGMLFPRRPR